MTSRAADFRARWPANFGATRIALRGQLVARYAAQWRLGIPAVRQRHGSRAPSPLPGVQAPARDFSAAPGQTREPCYLREHLWQSPRRFSTHSTAIWATGKTPIWRPTTWPKFDWRSDAAAATL